MFEYRFIEYELDRLLHFMWKNFKFLGDRVHGRLVINTKHFNKGLMKRPGGGIRHENKK